MTVAELMAKLAEFPPDVEVITTWESIYQTVEGDEYLAIRDVEDGRKVVVIEAEYTPPWHGRLKRDWGGPE